MCTKVTVQEGNTTKINDLNSSTRAQLNSVIHQMASDGIHSFRFIFYIFFYLFLVLKN